MARDIEELVFANARVETVDRLLRPAKVGLRPLPLLLGQSVIVLGMLFLLVDNGGGGQQDRDGHGQQHARAGHQGLMPSPPAHSRGSSGSPYAVTGSSAR